MRIGAYEIEDELGRGGMGVVYRARSADGRAVALKVLSATDADALALFGREKRLLGSFEEADGFVSLIDSGVEGGRPWLAMPLIEGGTLAERLARGPLPPAEAIALARTLAAALGRAHEKGVIHRDLKPANILFSKGQPLVADLGLAKHFRRDVPDASASASLTATGVIAGTAGYMAPEQIQDSRRVGPPCDVFALGAILHECLAGSRPFAGGGILEFVAALDRGPVPLRQAASHAPRWLDDVVARALERDPTRRFADAGAFGRALASAEARARGRRRAGLGAAVVALLLLIAVVGVAARTSSSSPAPPPAPPRPAPPAPPPPSPDSAKTPTSQEISDLVAHLEESLAAQDFQGAEEAATTALARYPSSTAILRCRALARSRRNDLDGAFADIERAMKIDPRDADLWLNRAALHAQRRDQAARLDDVTHAIELAPKLGEAWLERAKLWVGAHEYERARSDATRAIGLMPLAADAWRIRADARYAASDQDDAGVISDATRAIELDPSPPAYAARALARERRGDHHGALEDVDRSVVPGQPDPPGFAEMRDTMRGRLPTRDPDTAQRLLGQGEALLKAQDFSGALQVFSAAIEKDPLLAAAWMRRASIQLTEKRTEVAVADATRAIELDRGRATSWFARATARAGLQDVDGALSDLQHVFELSPDDPLAFVLRAELHERRDELPEALADLERAAKRMSAAEDPSLRDDVARRLARVRARVQQR